MTMILRRSIRLAALVMFLILTTASWAACGHDQGGTGTTAAPRGSPPTASGTPSPSASRPDETPSSPSSPASPRLADLRLAGQRVIFSYQGPVPPAGLLSAIKAGEVAGVIFFKGNITSRAQLREVAATLQEAAAQSPTHEPLLLMTDQEGGAIRRLAGAPLLSEKAIGRSPDGAAAAAEAGRGAALNLADVGLNVNLSPVLDVYRAPGDFVDVYGRSYSMDPTVVASLGTAFIAAQQRAGVAATAKHFPGLGAATSAQDTDARPVTLGVPLGTLRTVDELPYRSAIAAGVRLVMVSWATYPALDAVRPAGLSPVVAQQELRGRLGFSGVTVTDSLGAGALSAFGGTGERAVLAAGAGMDLLLCADKRASEGMSAVKALAAALASGRLDPEAFAASSARVNALRSALQQD